MNAKAFATLALAVMLTAPFVSATDPVSEPTPATTSLVLNAATPSNPIVSYTEGTEPLAEVRILNTEPMAGGFTITDPTGVARFTNQFSNDKGVVVFFEVYWGMPHGDWIVTHKPGLPGISIQPKPGEPIDPKFVADNYASEVLLTFNIDPLRTPHKVAYETVEPVLEPWRDESIGSILATAGETAKQEVREAQDKYPVAVDPVEPAEPLWETVNDAIGGKYSGASGAGGGTGGCASGCTDGGNWGGTSHYGPPNYSFCAYENSYCSFSGVYDVAYGNQGYYRYAYSIQGGIWCGSDNFGDPVPGVAKACYIKRSGDATYVGPSGYDWCNYEHLYCEFSGTRDVAYGNHGYYYYRYGVTGGLQCDSNEFGDPFYGTQKACWSKPSDGEGGSGGPTYIGPSDYDFCSYESQYCSFTGTRDVAYGNHGYYYYRYGVRDGISCTNDEFGDPYYGTHKGCYVSQSGSNTQTSCTNWQLQSNEWKWVNLVVAHAPYGGTSLIGTSSVVTNDVYIFGFGSQSQSFTGRTLAARAGQTGGYYVLMGAAHYTCDVSSRVVLTEFESLQEQRTVALHGPDFTTDRDDVRSFWLRSDVAQADVLSVALNHQFQERDDYITTQPTAPELCIEASNVDSLIYGLDVSVSFGNGVTIGGQLKFTTTETNTASYQYCFGTGHHSYEWDNLGGGPFDEELAKAFHMNW